MAYLNGNHIPNVLRFNTLISKYVGTVCSVSAGLPMGNEVRKHARSMMSAVLGALSMLPLSSMTL